MELGLCGSCADCAPGHYCEKRNRRERDGKKVISENWGLEKRGRNKGGSSEFEPRLRNAFEKLDRITEG